MRRLIFLLSSVAWGTFVIGCGAETTTPSAAGPAGATAAPSPSPEKTSQAEPAAASSPVPASTQIAVPGGGPAPGGQAEGPRGRPTSDASAVHTAGTAPGGDSVAVQILDYDALQKLVAVHKGRIVVLDVWSTTCVPCIKEFPHLVKLHRRYGADQLAAISVNSDYRGLPNEKPNDHRDKVLSFLQKQGATFDNVISSTADDELYEKLGVFAPPAVLVYGRDGQLVQQFGNDGQFTYADAVAPLVEILIAQPAEK